MSEDRAAPAVILGCFRHGGLAIVRSLGRLGVQVHAVHNDRWTPAFFSRYCRVTSLWDLQAEPAEASLRFLGELGDRIGVRSVLIPTSDTAAMFVAEHAERLVEWYRFPAQDAGLVRSLCSKKEMYHLARRWQLPTPETAFPRARQDVLEYLQTARFPILLKPIYSNLAPRGSRSITLVHSEHELLESYRALENPLMPNIMLQEYIPGGDEMTWTFNGYFDRTGECRLAFTGRKLRNYPPYFGQASLGICVRNDEVVDMTIRFMTAIGYRGPLDLGYRYDVRDGRYKVNDVNPRVGAMFRLFVGDNGTDVARALYQDMTGQPITEASTVEGRKWVVEDCDWIAALRYWRDGRLTFAAWLDSLRGIDEASYLAADDPLPVAGAVVVNLRNALSGRARAWRAAHTQGRGARAAG